MSETIVIGSKRDNSPVIITNDDALCMDEIYTLFYECNKCGSGLLFEGNNYCSNCGRLLEWDVNWETS